MQKIELVDFIRSDCKLLKPDVSILIEIYKLSNGDPCRECCYNGSCQVLKSFQLKEYHKASGQTKYIGKTNQQIADELGISKRQVAKMRKRGEI